MKKINIGEVLRESAVVYRENFAALTGFAIISTLALEISTVLSLFQPSKVATSLNFVLGFASLSCYIFTLYLSTRLSMSMQVYAFNKINHNDITRKDAFRLTKGKVAKFFKYYAVIILAVLPLTFAEIMITRGNIKLMVMAIVLFIYPLFSMLSPIMLFEDKKGFLPFYAASFLNGNYWRVFVVYFLVSSVFSSVGVYMTVFFNPGTFESFAITTFFNILHLFFGTFGSVAIVTIYMKLRDQKLIKTK